MGTDTGHTSVPSDKDSPLKLRSVVKRNFELSKHHSAQLAPGRMFSLAQEHQPGATNVLKASISR
jgi:hypothetical protein